MPFSDKFRDTALMFSEKKCSQKTKITLFFFARQRTSGVKSEVKVSEWMNEIFMHKLIVTSQHAGYRVITRED